MTGGAAGRTGVELAFFLPPEDLRPFITTYYHMKITGAGKQPVVDYLHPEWTNLRYFASGHVKASVGCGEPDRIPRLSLTGPTSLATLFAAGTGESWGIGILPLGWARLTDASAHDFADRVCNPSDHAALASLSSAEHVLREGIATPGEMADRLSDYFRMALAQPGPREDAIVSIQSKLVDPETSSVAEIAESANMSVRTLERFSRDVFGFSPQVLLRRQRFLRSLAQFMLDPTLKWIETLDPHYHDQAHFVRDFKHFMKMTPREYAALDHPVLAAAAKARMEVAGAAMQVLHEPGSPS